MGGKLPITHNGSSTVPFQNFLQWPMLPSYMQISFASDSTWDLERISKSLMTGSDALSHFRREKRKPTEETHVDALTYEDGRMSSNVHQRASATATNL
jgi:hypothetical protein